MLFFILDAAGWWFSPVSSTNKTDHYEITEMLLKVALNTINSNPNPQILLKVALNTKPSNIVRP
jgi:hypothetical protein